MRLVKLLALASALTVLMASVAMAGPVFDRIQKEKKIRIGIMTDSIPKWPSAWAWRSNASR